MGSTKRKNDVEGKTEKPHKKAKSTDEAGLNTTTLRDEEPAFARGGASVLTPLEHKQIQIRAKQDVLFEQTTGKRSAPDLSSDDEENESGHGKEEAGNNTQKVGPKKRTKSKRSKDQHKKPVDQVPKVEGLSYRLLVPGAQVLGQISKINKLDVTVTLPNNLVGYLPLTSISKTVTARAEKLAGDSSDDDDVSMNDEPELELESLFYLGQYVRTYVVAVGSSKDQDSRKKHIELSTQPRLTNIGIDATTTPVNALVQVEVLSVEDHGVVVDLELEGGKIKGFISSKEMDPSIKMNNLQVGAVLLCIVTGRSSNGKIVKLSADPQRIGNLKKGNLLSDPQSIDAFLPGSAVEVLVSELLPTGFVGKVFGVLDATADLIHSGDTAASKPLSSRVSMGQKVKARVIFSLPTAEGKKIGVSLLDHVLSMSVKQTTDSTSAANPVEVLPLSATVDEARVVKILPTRGLVLDLGVKGVRGFVHISRISDDKIETLSEDSGQYKLGSVHKCRIVSYNSMDGLFSASMEQKILDLPFLQLEDIKLGQVVKGNVLKLASKDSAVTGAIINITENVQGFVPEIHLADVRLQHPERKFKESTPVVARVLAVDLDSRRLRLTLKKTLVNSEAAIWSSYDDLEVGMEAPGTLTNIKNSGAVVQFYGSVRAFLPVSLMSESYIKDATQHFREGQVVKVHIVSIDTDEERMIVSCRDRDAFGPTQEKALQQIEPGQKVQGTVSEKTANEIIVELADSSLKAVLPNDHLVDGSSQKCLSSAKRIRVGQALQEIVVLSKDTTKKTIRLTSKPSLLKVFSSKTIPKTFEEIAIGSRVTGFIKNIATTGVYIQFANDLVGLLPKGLLDEDTAKLVDFGYKRFQTIDTTVTSIDSTQRRFLVSQKQLEPKEKATSEKSSTGNKSALANDAVDGVSTSIDDYTMGKLTKVKIASIKETQLNVQLAEGVLGRIDVSEIFDGWKDIKKWKRPLSTFSLNQIIPARVMGMHDTKNHRFLPITHVGKAPVFELTAKPSALKQHTLNPLTLDQVSKGEERICFVNNIADDCVWVNLSPNVRGRIRAIDMCDDLSLLSNMKNNFPVGAAIRAKVTRVDLENHRLDLSARKSPDEDPLPIDKLSEGMVLPGRITKITERSIVVQLTESLSAPVFLVNMSDDFSKVNPTTYEKHQFARVCILKVDAPNKRLLLSMRPSRVLSSSLPIVDKEVYSATDVKVHDVVRGFIKHVGDKGIFVSLGGDCDAYVRIAELSDSYVKDWKSEFEIDSLVTGKVISIDVRLNKIQLSLKKSVLDPNYKPPVVFTDLSEGQIVTGKVRKVAEFGVFIVVDDSANVSGLCHRSEMVDGPAPDVGKLYEEGDKVKAKILSIDPEQRKISLGLKASYFDVDQAEEDDSDDSDAGGVLIGSDSEDDSEEADTFEDLEVEDVNSEDEMDEGGNESLGGMGAYNTSLSSLGLTPGSAGGLKAGGFDWTGDIFGRGSAANAEASSEEEEEEEEGASKKRKKKRSEIQIDRTADLDANGPQSVADFERLLLGQPNSSYLWLSYMAFELQLGEIQKARDIAERALKTINSQSRDGAEESLNVWVAYLNLENAYGTDERLEEVFKRACGVNDSEEVHNRLASIYIQSQKNEKAEELLQTMVKKFSQKPGTWLNYATFLFDTIAEADRARQLLPRALQALPKHENVGITMKFAQLEYRSSNGDAERGRTMFEGLISTFPKRLDLWNVLLDLEIKAGDKATVRRLFERVTASGLKAQKAKIFFKKWLEFEEREGDAKSREKVKAKAAEFVRQQEPSS